MISLVRIRKASAIKTKYRGSNKEKKELELLKAKRSSLSGKIEKINFDSTYWKLSKIQLLKESSGKCAYCEANTSVVAHGDVEHYRPKSIYWWLAYTYDNYLFACQICNQVYKSDHFPIKGILLQEPSISATSTDFDLGLLLSKLSPDPLTIDTNFTLQQYLQNHKNEKPLLLNPYIDTPEDIIAYEFDDFLGEVKMIAAHPQYTANIQAMEEFYGINRIELKSYRYSIFRTFRILKKCLPTISDQQLRQDILLQINRMQDDSAIFAGMVRFFDKIL